MGRIAGVREEKKLQKQRADSTAEAEKGGRPKPSYSWIATANRRERGTPMQMPNVVHPTRFKRGQVEFEVVTYMPINDQQAQAIVLMALARKPALARGRGRVQIPWLGDQDSLALLRR